MNSEITKTSLLVIASILTATGAAILVENTVTGSLLLAGAVVVLIVRGVLKVKGIELESNNDN